MGFISSFSFIWLGSSFASLSPASKDGHTTTAFAPEAFINPPSEFHPSFRYWLPDASVDPDTLVADIKRSHGLGAGGIEFLGFYEYGGQLGEMPPNTDWSTYGFGTQAYRELFKRALRTHLDEGIRMDFAIGPNQGQGVPAHPNDTGLQWDLIPYTIEVPPNGIFSGIVPGWFDGNLLSVVTALVSSTHTITSQVTGLNGLENITYQEYTLRHETLAEHFDRVDDSTGWLRIRLPTPAKGTHYRIFAFYERLSGHRNLKFNSTRNTSIFDLGSFAVDHFDAKGARVIADFWEDNLLTDEISELLPQAGGFAWEDSIELPSKITWSNTLLARFKKLFGYQLEPYLPLITFGQNNLAVQSSSPGSFRCLLDTEDQGVRYINDFRAALVHGYTEYIQTLKAWANDVLKVGLSVQPAYGMPMDIQATIHMVDVPECESLTFFDSIDSYRQFSGPASLQNRNVISNEMGAVRGLAYQYHLAQLLFSINRALDGGINRFVLHGQPYSGEYHSTTWPGYTPFGYLFSEAYSPRLPTWNNGLKAVLHYISRMQYIQQQGIPKIDLAIYNKESATTFRDVTQAAALLNGGWSYNYLSPENLGVKQAEVHNKTLAANGPAWKALIVESSQNITMDALIKLKSFAESGLPVVFSGGVPGHYLTAKRSGHASFKRRVSELLKMKNVYSVESGRVTNLLTSLRLAPNVRTETNGTWYTTWREDKGIAYALVYSDLHAASGSITVQTTETPYVLDPWSGAVSPVAIYRRDQRSTTIPLTLSGNQTIVLAFSNRLSTQSLPSIHVETAPAYVLKSEYSDSRIVLSAVQSKSSDQAKLSNGTVVSLNTTSVPGSFELSNWNLTVEHWNASSNLSDLTETAKYNTSHLISRPVSWA